VTISSTTPVGAVYEAMYATMAGEQQISVSIVSIVDGERISALHIEDATKHVNKDLTLP
jgi:ribosomal protein L20A (L18A)